MNQAAGQVAPIRTQSLSKAVSTCSPQGFPRTHTEQLKRALDIWFCFRRFLLYSGERSCSLRRPRIATTLPSSLPESSLPNKSCIDASVDPAMPTLAAAGPSSSSSLAPNTHTTHVHVGPWPATTLLTAIVAATVVAGGRATTAPTLVTEAAGAGNCIGFEASPEIT